MGIDTAPVIVSYQRLSEKLNKALAKQPNLIINAAKETDPDELESETPLATDEEAAGLMEELTKALKNLESKGQDPGILVSIDDRFTSILQSYIAENSLQKGKVEPLDDGGLEAQFDEHDILG